MCTLWQKFVKLNLNITLKKIRQKYEYQWEYHEKLQSNEPYFTQTFEYLLMYVTYFM